MDKYGLKISDWVWELVGRSSVWGLEFQGEGRGVLGCLGLNQLEAVIPISTLQSKDGPPASCKQLGGVLVVVSE